MIKRSKLDNFAAVVVFLYYSIPAVNTLLLWSLNRPIWERLVLPIVPEMPGFITALYFMIILASLISGALTLYFIRTMLYRANVASLCADLGGNVLYFGLVAIQPNGTIPSSSWDYFSVKVAMTGYFLITYFKGPISFKRRQS